VASSEYLAYDWTKFHPVFLVEEKRSGGTYAHERARARAECFLRRKRAVHRKGCRRDTRVPRGADKFDIKGFERA